MSAYWNYGNLVELTEGTENSGIMDFQTRDVTCNVSGLMKFSETKTRQ